MKVVQGLKSLVGWLTPLKQKVLTMPSGETIVCMDDGTFPGHMVAEVGKHRKDVDKAKYLSSLRYLANQQGFGIFTIESQEVILDKSGYANMADPANIPSSGLGKSLEVDDTETMKEADPAKIPFGLPPMEGGGMDHLGTVKDADLGKEIMKRNREEVKTNLNMMTKKQLTEQASTANIAVNIKDNKDTIIEKLLVK